MNRPPNNNKNGTAATGALPYVETDLLTATCTPGGETVYRNEAWNSVFGNGDEDDPWVRLEETDRLQVNGALTRAASGALETNRICPVHVPSRDEPLPVLLNFLPVYLPDDVTEQLDVQAVVVTGEVLAEPSSWTPSQTQRHRMEALGHMSMGITHDFKNLLSALLGHTELLQRRLEGHDDLPDFKESLDTIEQAAIDGATMIEKLQRFSRQESQSQFEVLDLSELIKGCITLTRPYWYNEPRRQGITIELERTLRSVPPIEGVATELREVLINLILNAVQAMPDGGQLTLRTDYDQERGVQAIIRDTGTGMSADVRERIFEPLFTTKGDYGTGMGLAVSYGIVQEHEGSIRVDSSLGQGTRFTLSFPPAEAAPDDEDDEPQQPSTEHLARVLIVDDEKRVRSVLEKLLALKGHTVAQATSGAEALALMENRGFDVVITDYAMPAMNGRQLSRTLRRRFPDLPIVLLTGDPEMTAGADVDLVLSKPFRLDQLETAIQELL